MDLSVVHRLLLLEILPEAGSITTLRIVRDLREALSFTEQEHADLHLVQADGRVTWDRTKESLTAVEIGPKATAIIRAALASRNAAQTLRADHLDLWDRFMAETGVAD